MVHDLVTRTTDFELRASPTGIVGTAAAAASPAPRSSRCASVALSPSLARGALLLVALLVAACASSTPPVASHGGSGGPLASATAAAAGLSPSASAGLTRDEAVRIASGFVQPGSPLVSADSGKYGELVQGGASAPDTLVWVVRFRVSGQQCLPGPSPEPSPCITPGPGQWTVVLDYTTGARISSGGGSN
jgi:hypothetical protein